MSFDRTPTTTTTTITPQPPSNCCSVILAWLYWPPLALLIFFGLSQINIITTITQKQCVDVAPCALMQTSQTILHSPITFRRLSLYCATLPILTCICTLACTVPHTHNCSHLLSRSHSHSHFTRTSPMPCHRSHSLVLASTLLFSLSAWLRHQLHSLTCTHSQ